MLSIAAMNVRWPILLLLGTPATAWGQCQLCPPTVGDREGTEPSARPLNITIETALDFSRVGGTRGGGSVAIDERSGMRAVSGLIDLGGYAIKGSARVTGEPFRRVRIGLPSSIRLTALDGGSADAVDLRTDLPADARLDGGGALVFAFAGRLVVTGDASGAFTGRIAITADYD